MECSLLTDPEAARYGRKVMADDGKHDITIRLLLLKQYLEANAG